MTFAEVLYPSMRGRIFAQFSARANGLDTAFGYQRLARGRNTLATSQLLTPNGDFLARSLHLHEY